MNLAVKMFGVRALCASLASFMDVVHTLTRLVYYFAQQQTQNVLKCGLQELLLRSGIKILSHMEIICVRFPLRFTNH